MPAPRQHAGLLAALLALSQAAELRAAAPETPASYLADVARVAVANSRAVRLAALGRKSARVARWAAQDRDRPDLLLAYENDLVVARLRELAAVVARLDGLNLLDEAVGTTLDTGVVPLGKLPAGGSSASEATPARFAEVQR